MVGDLLVIHIIIDGKESKTRSEQKRIGMFKPVELDSSTASSPNDRTGKCQHANKPVVHISNSRERHITGLRSAKTCQHPPSRPA
jgi:hypothetical protein